MKRTFDNQSRRQFLTRMSALLASGAACSLLPQLRLISSASAQMANDYRAIVCIDLVGGNDSHNTLIPHAQEEYDIYRATRGGVYDKDSNPAGLAIARDALLQITDSSGKTWGLHPACEGLQTLFNDDNLSFVSGVGPLWEPVMKPDLTGQSGRRARTPSALGDHRKQQILWRQGHPSNTQFEGWGGLTGENVHSMNAAAIELSPNISAAGFNEFTTGAGPGFSLGPDGMVDLPGFAETGGKADRVRARALEELLERQYSSPFINEGTAMTKSYRALSSQIKDAMESATASLTSEFPDSNLGRQMRQILKMIAASRDVLGYRRQVFYARIGGWDTHGDQMERNHARLLSTVSECMLAFRNALREINAEHQVTTFTQSEFGRTLTSNGSGTDHAWAGVQWVMGKPQSQGGSLLPRRIFGDYPIMDLNDSDLIYHRRGHVIPTVSTQAFGATFSRWMGVGENDLGAIFPNLDRFDLQDVGFLG